MPTFSKEFQALKQVDCENYQDLPEIPPIRFAPEETGLSRQSMAVTELSVEPGETTSTKSYKYTYHVFSNGKIEGIITWTKEFKAIEVKKPLTTAGSKFAMMRVMLDGNARVTFKTLT